MELPTGETAKGRVSSVGTVASKAGEDSDPTVDVTIAVRGRGKALDQAPVDVGFAVERSRDALAVPVKALLARQGGGYALELPDGTKLPVEAGLYADDMVEVSGDGVREGLKVVTARWARCCGSWTSSRRYPGGVEALRGVSLNGHGRRGRSPSSGRRGPGSRRCCT